MKITPSAGFEQYKNYVNKLKNDENATVKGQGGGRAQAAQNTDKVTLSGQAAARAETSRLASAISAEVDVPASATRIASLKEQVESGTYHVPSSALADAILGLDTRG